jgi:hypothetical protein
MLAQGDGDRSSPSRAVVVSDSRGESDNETVFLPHGLTLVRDQLLMPFCARNGIPS